MKNEPRPDPIYFRAAARRPVPWKNGGGVTSEIAVFPVDSSMEDFGWRISTALVESAGPFSKFEGIDRILTVLEGKLVLRFAADNHEVILNSGQSHAFAGDVAVKGMPQYGPVRDLNVMVRRGGWQAQVSTTLPQLTGTDTLIAIASQSTGGLDILDAVEVTGNSQLPADFVGYFIRLRPTTGSQSMCFSPTRR